MLIELILPKLCFAKPFIGNNYILVKGLSLRENYLQTKFRISSSTELGEG